ncbi:TPA: hypothetical protein I7147_18110 [Vibrio vulnificus]|uniref:hypothetical protein n=1 Tax=Vibrio vulnificus TaxID=672 RepID=UPI0005F17510|nr:hypothetical protein [Vibrio vulnificus]ELK8603187.1 hypothetical protein [Vibrio vulnificus]MCA3980892.1 hypothetical protein [Vibrio vulnificus]POB65850.1 hypothetical protein CRN59_34255 [Vibrio vulnificus]HAS6110392.1 hypothetical protein [Vibrio vulnificus]HAS6180784.1 hypothetical protein [Vibrio vulnificus]
MEIKEYKSNPSLKCVRFDNLVVHYDSKTFSASVWVFASVAGIECSTSVTFYPTQLVHQTYEGSDYLGVNLQLVHPQVNLYFDTVSDYIEMCNFFEIEENTDVCIAVQSSLEASA